jgi:hypothetical protein
MDRLQKEAVSILGDLRDPRISGALLVSVGALKEEARVKQILTGRRDDLERIVAQLVEKETLDRIELQSLIGLRAAPTKETSSVYENLARITVP